MGLSIETETVILADADGFADEAALSSAWCFNFVPAGQQ